MLLNELEVLKDTKLHVAHRKSDEVNKAEGTAQEDKKDDETVPF